MAAGRPSKYSDAYCNEVIETMGTGLSLTAFAGEIGVARSTINEWMGAHPEFSEAVKVGTAKRVKYLERRLLDGEIGPRVTSHIFALKNADPEEWREKQHVEHSVNDDQIDRILRYQGRLNG
jgi:hypothetical protein